MTDSQETAKTLWVRKDEITTNPPGRWPRWHEASPSEIIEAALNDFPTDEDIEAAAKALHDYVRSPDDNLEWSDLWAEAQASYEEAAQALLLAVADARRTEEEWT